jgi:hypothetical protein
MVEAGYTIGEIRWLLGLTYSEALAHDESVSSSFPSAEADLAVSAEEPQLPAIVRWREVRDIAAKIVTEKRDRQILSWVVVDAMTEWEVAAKVGLNQSTVNRRVGSMLVQIQAALGGPPVIKTALSVRRPCAVCEARPRVRAQGVRREPGGYWIAADPERELAWCVSCLPPKVRPRVLLQMKYLVQTHKRAASVT